jgi:ABC-type multidrug transport system ATPase subunit
MDPLNKKKVWGLIQDFKKNGSTVVMTTHQMHEADVLSDRIAIISNGQFQCIGTSLFLKKNFGSGYKYVYFDLSY